MPDAKPKPTIDLEALSVLSDRVDHARECVEVAFQIVEGLQYDYLVDRAERAAIELLTTTGKTADFWRDLRNELRLAGGELDDAVLYLADLESRLEGDDLADSAGGSPLTATVIPFRKAGSGGLAVNAVILIDTSGSMAHPLGDGRRIDALASVLEAVLPTTPGVRLFSFNTTVTELVEAVGVNLPEPEGSTALHLALEHVAPLRPNRLIVISDGEPDDAQAAVRAAKALVPIVIDAFYVGPKDAHAAIGFMKALSLAGGRLGIAGLRNLADTKALAEEIRLRLTGPASL